MDAQKSLKEPVGVRCKEGFQRNAPESNKGDIKAKKPAQSHRQPPIKLLRDTDSCEGSTFEIHVEHLGLYPCRNTYVFLGTAAG